MSTRFSSPSTATELLCYGFCVKTTKLVLLIFNRNVQSVVSKASLWIHHKQIKCTLTCADWLRSDWGAWLAVWVRLNVQSGT